jgi:hypothetical protein
MSEIEYHWSALPGNFLNKFTGQSIKEFLEIRGSGNTGPIFTGDQAEWNETLIETVLNVNEDLHNINFLGRASTFRVCVSPAVLKLFVTSCMCSPSKYPRPSIFKFRQFEVFEDTALADDIVKIAICIVTNSGVHNLEGSIKLHDFESVNV